jgi:DNA-binding phage protein
VVDVNKLRGKIVEKGMNVSYLASKVGINASTLYRRLKGGGGSFTIEEADKIASVLALTSSELNSIFFAQYVA